MTTETAYRSDLRPDMTPFEEQLGSIRGFAFEGTLTTEVAAGAITGPEAMDLLDDMLAIREMEEMIVRLRSGGYEPLPGLRLPRPDPRLDRPGGVPCRREPCAARRRTT